MQSSLSWIEWLDRLDRVLNGAREDVRVLASFDDPQALAVVERCKRQLTALTDDLRFLDRRVLSTKPGAANTDRAGNLQKALDTTVFHLGTAVKAPVAESRSARALARHHRLGVARQLLRGGDATRSGASARLKRASLSRPAGTGSQEKPENEAQDRQYDHDHRPQHFVRGARAALKNVHDRPDIGD